MSTTTMLRGAAVAFCSAILIAGCSSVTETGPSTDNTSKNVSTPTTVVSPKGTGTVAGGVNQSGPGFILELVEAGVPDPDVPGQYFWSWKITQKADQKFGIDQITLYLDACITQANIIEADRSQDGVDWSKAANMQWGDNAAAGCDDIFDPAHLVMIPNISSPVGYFRLVVNAQYITTGGTAIWKAGPQCGTTPFMGLGCDPTDPQGDNEGCSYSLGFYFASPVSAGIVFPGWGTYGGTVTVGNQVYTEAEARAIFASKNGKTGMTPAKLSFLQCVALLLSEPLIDPDASVWDDFAICNAYLTGLNTKLTPQNVNSFGKTPKNVQEAAGRIGRWIDSHHCDDLTP